MHHSERPKKVASGAAAYTRAGSRERLSAGNWFYDEGAKNLHVRATSPARADVIINISF